MAKKDAVKDVEETKSDSSPNEYAKTFFKEAKGYHYNDCKNQPYKVPFSSLILTAELGGGLGAGCHRFIGRTSGGKTSAALDLMLNFLRQRKKRRGVYFKCEGRFSENMQERSGIKFVTDAAEWEDGTCLVIKSNIFEHIFSFKRNLIMNDTSGTEYFFLVDSADGMVKKDDFDKGFDEAAQVAGGALLTSVYLKKVGIAMAERGHISVFISQVRETIKASKYTPNTQRQGTSSGSHALEHQADFVLDFQWRNKEDYFFEKDEFGVEKPIGHKCCVSIVKSDNEKYDVEVTYPIRYGRVNGTSVWVEQEIFELLKGLKYIELKGAWINVSTVLVSMAKEAGIDIQVQHHGQAEFRKYLEQNQNITKYLFDMLVQMLSGKSKI